MGEAIGEILPLAIGVAVSVVPIVAVILMLFTERASANSLSFLAGWAIGLIAVGTITLAIAAGSGAVTDAGEPKNGVGIVKLVLGVGLLFLAYRNWRSRPTDGAEAPTPKWMASIDTFGPGKSAGLAALLSGVNPKNLALTVGAATTIAASGLSTGAQIGTLAVFIVLASLTVAAPVVAYLVAGSRADDMLDSVKSWLIAHNNAIMAVLFLVFGAKLVGDGVSILAA